MNKVYAYIFIILAGSGIFYLCHIFYPTYQKTTLKREEYLKQHNKDINIAVVWPESEDSLFKKGVEFARDLINNNEEYAISYVTDKNEKIKRNINIISYPENTKPQGQSSAKKIAEDKTIAAVIGHDSSSSAIPASISYQYNGIIYMSPVATSNVLTQHNFNYIFRNAPRDSDYAKALFDFCNKKGLKRIAVLYSRDTYGTNFSDIFVEIAAGFKQKKNQSLGDIQKVMNQKEKEYVPTENKLSENSNASPKNKLQIVVQKSYSPDGGDFLQLVSELSPYDYDCIFLAGLLSQKAGEVIVQLRRFDINVPIIGGDGLDSADLGKIPHEASNNTFVASVFDQTPNRAQIKGGNAKEMLELSDQFIKKYGVPPDYDAAQGFEAVFILSQAFTRARSTSPLLVSSTLKAFDDFRGPSGTISFSKGGDIEKKEIFIKEMKNGKFKKIGD